MYVIEEKRNGAWEPSSQCAHTKEEALQDLFKFRSALGAPLSKRSDFRVVKYIREEKKGGE